MQHLLENNISISGAIRLCLQKKLNFATFRLPGETATFVLQKSPDCLPLKRVSNFIPESGFLMVPFSKENCDSFLISPDLVAKGSISAEQVEIMRAIPENNPTIQETSIPEDTLKEDYIGEVTRSIRKIKEGEFEKVVLSRIKSVAGNFSTLLPAIFDALCSAYPNAFVYLCSVNGQCWTGASPEPFVGSYGNEIRIVSLAGTRSFAEKNMDIGNWNNKELQEQEYVTFHIEKILQEYNIRGYKKDGPYVARAGNLTHLRTDFSFPHHEIGARLPALISSLHPTPAVCGMSTGKAMDFIKDSEKHDRAYYAGFLGPVGIADRMRLYMNLRCMRVYNNRLLLYIGGGITGDSIPEDEWEETEIKADTLLSIIKAIG